MRRMPVIIGLLFLPLILFVCFYSRSASAAAASHIVISEIQVQGATTNDDFVEIYNPTSSPQNITGWALYRKTASGTVEIMMTTASGIIPAHGYYLFANTGYDGNVTADTSYSENITDNNTILLRDNNAALIDLVGMGTALTFETNAIAIPIDNRSIERKAKSTSTATDMATGGINTTDGNGEDTDNNTADFVRHVSPNVSNPQNSQSAVEPLFEQSPIPSLTPTPNPSISPSPEPTEAPSPTPTLTPSITPNVTPSAMPIPSATSVPMPSPTLIPSPTPTVDGRIIASGLYFTCRIKYKSVKIFTKFYFFPMFTCEKTSN